MNQNEKKTAFILAAGLGTRLKELTTYKPKALVELNGETLLEINLKKLINQGFNHFVVNIHHFGDTIIDFINDRKFRDINIEISDERNQLLDTGGAILKALPLFKDSKAILIHNVDIITNIELGKIYDNFVKSEDAVQLLTQNRDNKRKLVFDKEDNFLGRYNLETNTSDDKIILQEEHKLLSFSGIHLIKPQYFDKFKIEKCYVFELYKKISENQNVKSHYIQPDYWFDLGTINQIKEASSWLLSQK